MVGAVSGEWLQRLLSSSKSKLPGSDPASAWLELGSSGPVTPRLCASGFSPAKWESDRSYRAYKDIGHITHIRMI